VSSNFEVANKGTLLLHSHYFLSPRRAAGRLQKNCWGKQIYSFSRAVDLLNFPTRDHRIHAARLNAMNCTLFFPQCRYWQCISTCRHIPATLIPLPQYAFVASLFVAAYSMLYPTNVVVNKLSHLIKIKENIKSLT